MYFYNEKTNTLHIKDHCTHSKNPLPDIRFYTTEEEARDSVGQEARLCENCRKIRDRIANEEKRKEGVTTTIEEQPATDKCTQAKPTPAKRKINYPVIGTFLIGSISFALIFYGEIFMSLLCGLLLAVIVFSLQSLFHSMEEKNERERKAKEERERREKAEQAQKKSSAVSACPHSTVRACSSSMIASDSKAIYDTYMATVASSTSASKPQKPASVVGRAAVGAAIAGPVGAVVGALSAVDKNNRSEK